MQANWSQLSSVVTPASQEVGLKVASGHPHAAVPDVKVVDQLEHVLTDQDVSVASLAPLTSDNMESVAKIERALDASIAKLPVTARLWLAHDRTKVSENLIEALEKAEPSEPLRAVTDRVVAPYQQWISGKGVGFAVLPNVALGFLASYFSGPVAYILGFVGGKVLGPLSTEFDQKFPAWVRAKYYPQSMGAPTSKIRSGPAELRGAQIVSVQSRTLTDMPRDGMFIELTAMTGLETQAGLISDHNPELAAAQLANIVLIFSRRYRQLERLADDHAALLRSVLGDKGLTSPEFFAAAAGGIRRMEHDPEIQSHALTVLEDIAAAKELVESPPVLVANDQGR